MSSKTVVELKNVWKKYSTRDLFHKSLREEITNLFVRVPRDKLDQDEFWALQDVNISVNQGECIGLYGPNGSGKTTILKLIANVTYPNQGEVFVKGRVAPLISVGAGFHPDLTGRENIYTNGTIIGMTIQEIREKIESIIEFSEIEKKFMHMPVKKYSTGMNTRLGFSIAIHSSSEIILIDEILAVGDESFQEKCISKVKDLVREQKTIIIVSHDKNRMEQLTDRILLIRNGEITNRGSKTQ